jgi:hypothetical protein
MFDTEKVKNLIFSRYKDYKGYSFFKNEIIQFTDIYIKPEEKIQNKLLNKEQIYIFQNDIEIQIDEHCIMTHMYLKNVLYDAYIDVFRFFIDSENELDNIFLNIDRMKKTMFNLNIKKELILKKIETGVNYLSGDWDFDDEIIMAAKNEINKQNDISDINLIYNNLKQGLINTNETRLDVTTKRYLINLINEIIIKKVSKSLLGRLD